jgi:hypothetical protein
METYVYKINASFARREGLPVMAVGVPLIETGKAFYVYGHGSLEVAAG